MRAPCLCSSMMARPLKPRSTHDGLKTSKSFTSSEIISVKRRIRRRFEIVWFLSFMLVVAVRTRQSSGFAGIKSSTIHPRRASSNALHKNAASVDSGGESGQMLNHLPVSRPFPVMPSQLFQQLALSQLELLATSLVSSDDGQGKIKSMALYLPQENSETGQLEFLPAVLYPHPTSERVFIASEADSGVAPTLPKTLTKLPGFAHANTLLPAYPMVYSSGDEAGVGVVEEVLCDLRGRATALSVPLFSGSQTVGVLLVSPVKATPQNGESVWTEQDRQQVERAAKSISLALSMDNERAAMEAQNLSAQAALSDGLHQLKNPLQALRTYGKLLQRRIADTGEEEAGRRQMTPQLLELADHLMVQSDRLADRLKPVDSIVDNMTGPKRLPSLNPAPPAPLAHTHQALLLPWENATLAFARSSSTPETRLPGKGQGSHDRTKKQTIESGDDNEQRDVLVTEQAASPSYSPLFDDDLQLEMTFIDDVLEPILSAFKAIASDTGVDFTVEMSDELPGITVSPQAVQEVISNILDNAFKYVKFMRANGGSSSVGRNPAPKVSIRLLPNEAPLDPGVTAFVHDNGPGIPSEDRDAVFDRGYRSPITSNDVKGSGIGLDIARALAEMMGGSLRVVDGNGSRGTTLELVLYRNPRVPLD